jgi:hypothetical protein
VLKNVRNILMYEYIGVIYPVINCLGRLSGPSGSSGRGRKYGSVAGMG